MRGSLLRAAIAAVFVMVAAAGPAAGQEPPRPNRGALLDELGRGRVATHAETGQLRYTAGTPARPSASSARLGRPANERAAARAFMNRYGPLFGVAEPARDLRVERSLDDGHGRTFVRFQQVQGDVPVLGGQLTVQVDRQGNVISALGEATPASNVETAPKISGAAARASALAFSARANDVGQGALWATEPSLWIYDPALLGPGKLPGARLVWRTEVRNGSGTINDFVLVDAAVGAVALRFSQVNHALNREVCDGELGDNEFPCHNPVLTESAGSSSVDDVNDAFDYAEDVYAFFLNRFGRDSLDGEGLTLVSTVRFCEFGDCDALNAFWNGEQAVFWPGLASDDVVAHEFVHGFTQYTSGLAYVYQSGAINESISDIFGEFVDLTNGAGTDTAGARWLLGEDTSLGPIRDMADPPDMGQPDRMGSPLYFNAGFGDNGGVHYNSGVGNKAAYLMVDGETFNGQTIEPIGLDKTAAVWYRAAAFHLASGSDYADLGAALNQACTDLVGATVKDGTGANSGTIETSDCNQVAKAVTATEMALQPTVSNASAPEAPVCTSGTPTNVFFDEIQEYAPGWSTGGTANRWFYDANYATSAPWSLYGATEPGPSDARLRRSAAVTLPANAFLHFRHAYFFDNWNGEYFDGGVVEYDLGGSNDWLDARTLFTHNGYNGTLETGVGNVLGGRQAFTGYSRGYISSRINLASLAGQSFRFRFRLATDDEFDDYGWFIDDVRLYTCVGAGGGDTTPPTVSPPNADLRSGVNITARNKIRLAIGFVAEDESGIASTALQKRANSGSYSNVGLSTPTSAFHGFAASSSTKRQFRAQATDDHGNTSAWVTAPAFRVLAHQNGSAAVTQSGTWKTGSTSNFFGGSVRYSGKTGARQSRTATVSDFAIVSTRGPNRGRADVYVDGVFQATVDLYSPTVQYRRVVYAIDFGTPGTHTIEWRVTGTKNPSSSAKRVDFDAFLALAP